MYEYAATAICPINLEPKTWDTIEVGPSAAPIIPIDAATITSNPVGQRKQL